MKTAIIKLTKWCAYSYIFKVIFALLKGGDISEHTRTGRNIALLGLFCPFFWYALLTGANQTDLLFHATHSLVVFLIGMVIMFFGIKLKGK